MGLMQSAEEELVIGSSVSYCFLHLTLQEYLAALHWSRMGSENMVRLISETSLFPLDTLVRDGITAGDHWPALYFLSGLTKLPLELLNISLKAADDAMLLDDDDDELVQVVLNGLDFYSFIKPLGGKQCNPYFFQVLFESQSRDLTTELFTRKSVAPAITNPLECFVTAWCVANSDPASQWKLTFDDMLSLEKFLEHFQRLAIGSSSTSLSSSFTGSIVQITMTIESQQHLISEHGEVKRGENRAEKLAHSMSSLCPCLECLMFWITTADIPLVVSFLRIAVQMVPLKTIIIINNCSDEDELGAAPPLHCPSLKTVWLFGNTSVAAPFIQSLILPNINTLTKILLMKCRPRSGSEFDNFCSFLCQSTSLEHVMCAADVDLNAYERKQLASALERIKSLKLAIYIPIEDIDYDRKLYYEDTLSNSRIKRLKENIMRFYKELYLLRRRSRLMCVISPMLIDSHSVSQNPVTIDMFDVISLDMFDDNSTEEGQEENEVALQTAAELQDDEGYDLLLTLMFSIETAQDEQKRRQVEQQQQALQSENEQGEKEKESAEGEDVQFPLAPSSMQAAEDEQRRREGEQQQLALQSEHEQDLSGDDQSAENDPNKEKFKNFKEQQQEFHKDEQTRQEEEQEETAAAEMLASYHPEDQRSKSQGENEMGLQTASAEQQDDNLQLVLSASIQTAQDEQRKKEKEQQQQASQSKEYRQKALQSADEQNKETVCGTMQSAEQDEEDAIEQ